MPPPGGNRTPLSSAVQWLTSLGRKSTTQDEAADKPVDVNQFKETFQPDDGRVTPTERRKSADARRRGLRPARSSSRSGRGRSAK
jgi:hypothetical protein